MNDLTILNRDVEEVLSELASWEGDIRNATDYEETAIFLQRVKGLMKKVAEYYEPDRKRQYEIYQAVLLGINEFTKPLSKAEASMKTALTRYHRTISNKIAEGADSTELMKTAFPDVKGLSLVETWGHKVEDEAAVPREYLMVDEKAIAAEVKRMKGMTDIPGVTVERNYTVRSRSI